MTQTSQSNDTFPRSALLSDDFIYRLPAPGRRVTVRDSRLSQLVLALGPRSRAWYLHATVRRATHRVHLGRFPVVGTDDARQQALEALRRIYAGEVATRQPRTTTTTLRQALTKYLEARDLRDSSAADCRGVIENHAAKWLDKPITGITGELLAAHYRAVSAKSTSSANKLMRCLSAVLRYAAAAGCGNDADMVRKAKTLLGGLTALPSRDRLVPDELQRAWFAEASKCTTPVRGLLVALALTGCRLNELRAAKASVWDSDAKLLRLPLTKTKPHTLPVGPYLAAMLNDAAKGAVLFDVSEHEARSAYERIGADIGNPFSPHDLRRGFATTAMRLGYEEALVKRLVNHSATGTTQRHYIRFSPEDLRPAMTAIEAHMLGLWGVVAANAEGQA